MERVSYHRLARRELNEAAQFYDSESPGLGSAFLDEIERCTQAIVDYPEAGSLIIGSVRRRLVLRFPYGTDSIEINTDVDTHRFRIVTGYTGDSQRIPTSVADAQPSNVIVTAAPSALASATIQLATSGGCSSSCC